jgi:modification methylase hhaI
MARLRGVDLFCGIGGFRLAMEASGVACVYSCDIDPFAQRSYAANFHEVPAGDITQLDPDTLPDFDLLCAGFPCQPFSYAGRLLGFEDTTRGTLFFDVCRVLAAKRPPMLFLENVKGLRSHNHGHTLQIILASLRELGYHIHTTVLSSLDFGLPQKRERWYCVGFLQDVPFSFPKPTGERTTLRSIVDPSDHAAKLTLPPRELALIDYHFAHAKNRYDRVQHDSEQYASSSKKGRYGVFSYQKPDGALRFHVGDRAKTQIQEAFYACLDTYAPTIIANRTPKLWDLRRRLSVLEAKRLQGFPDDFIFPVSDAQAYKQLGNSVSVPVVRQIMQRMLQCYLQFYTNKIYALHSGKACG